MTGEIQRRLALQTLVQVSAGRPLAPLLDVALAALPPGVSRGFLVELVKGSLTWQGRYEHLIRRFSRRRVPRESVLVNLLRLSLHQLVAMAAVPDYAAIHQAGELCRSEVSRQLVPYVNGLLQNVARRLAGPAETREDRLRTLFPPRDTDPRGFLATYHSHPRWLIDRWLPRFGLTACEALCRHNNRVAPLTFHVLGSVEPDAVAARLSQQGLSLVQGRRHERALLLEQRLDRQTLTDLLAGEPGLIVQDEGAQEVTAWLAAGCRGRVLDLCAAPGGKTFHIGHLRPPGTSLVAMDINRERLALLQQTAKRIETDNLSVLLADGLTPPFAAGCFDTVLVDGPCSGTGVMRHHPEGRWRLRQESLLRYRARLLELARRAASLLSPGGCLLYATCSLEPEENTEVVDALLAAEPSLEFQPGRDKALRAWLPHETGTDGFFAARLHRKG